MRGEERRELLRVCDHTVRPARLEPGVVVGPGLLSQLGLRRENEQHEQRYRRNQAQSARGGVRTHPCACRREDPHKEVR